MVQWLVGKGMAEHKSTPEGIILLSGNPAQWALNHLAGIFVTHRSAGSGSLLPLALPAWPSALLPRKNDNSVTTNHEIGRSQMAPECWK